MDIFKLVGSVFVDTEAAENSLKKTDEKAGNLGETLLKAAEKAGKFAIGLGEACVNAGKAVYNFASDAAETADNIDKMSQRLGLSREAYQELDFVMSQAGVDVDNFQSGMKSLLANMDRVTEGNATATANFEKLGISVTDTNGKLRTQEDVLWDTISAFQRMEESSEKNRLAQELFGRYGQEIIPMLNDQAGSVDELRQKAHELGLVLSDEVIDEGVTLIDTLDQTKRSMNAAKTQLGAGLMPVVTRFCEYIIKAMPIVTGLFDRLGPIIGGVLDILLPVLFNLLDNILPSLSSALESVLPLLDTIISTILPVLAELVGAILPVAAEIIGTILPVVVELLNQLLPPLVMIIENVLPVVITLLNALMPIINVLLKVLQPVLDLAVALLTPLLSLINLILPVLSSLVSMLLDGLKSLIVWAIEPLGEAVDFLASLLSDVFGGAMESILPIIKALQEAFNGIIDFIKNVFAGNWKDAWSGIVKTFSKVWGDLKEAAKNPINYVLQFVNKMISGVTNGLNSMISAMNKLKFDVPDWVPVIGGKTFGFNLGEIKAAQIPLLATGGDVEKEGKAIVGEKGPEMLTLPQGARVTPLDNHSAVESIDYDRLTKSIVNALREMLPQLTTMHVIEPDAEGIFEVVRVQSEQNALLGRAGLTLG